MPHGSVKIRGEAKQLSNDQLLSITQLIQSFDDFRPDSDVSELHDNGVVEFEGIKIVWQIEIPDDGLEKGRSSSFNCAVFQRKLVVMLMNDATRSPISYAE
jgi:hypothetical protein